jgi:hypothetical protein
LLVAIWNTFIVLFYSSEFEHYGRLVIKKISKYTLLKGEITISLHNQLFESQEYLGIKIKKKIMNTRYIEKDLNINKYLRES